MEHVTGAEVLKLNDKLVAFVTPADVNVELILEAAFVRLPHYMVPSLIVPLPEFPLTGNGKVDKKYLASMDLTDLWTAESGRFEDMTSEELKVAQMIAAVLGIDVQSLSPNADFFNLGGDSITAIVLAQQLGVAFATTLTTRTVFTKRTVKRLSAALLSSHEHFSKELKPIQIRYFDQH